MNQETPKYAAIYVRVSTEDQKEGLSVEVQEKLCRERAALEKYQVLEVLDADVGVSGNKVDRGGMNRLKELVSSKRIHVVIALSSDRLFRNTIAHMEFMNLVRRFDVRIIYINGMSPDWEATSIFTDTMMAGVNQFYRDQVSDKVKATLYEKARAGYFPTQPPVGYKNALNPQQGVEKIAQKIIVPDPDTAPLIEELFRTYATGLYSVYDLTDVMNDKGLRSHRGFKMAPSRIYDLLRNPVYRGEVHWGKIHVKDGKHAPLVDEATFNRVQMVLNANNHKACRRRKHKWLLAGFVWCQRHDRRYVAEWHLNKGRAYYHCPNRTGCGAYSEMTDLEGRVAELFKTLEFSEAFIESVITKTRALYTDQRKRYESRKAGLVSKRTAFEAKLKIAEEKLLAGTIDDDDFKRIRSEVGEDRSKVLAALDELEASRDTDINIVQEVLYLTRNLYQTYKEASPELKRQYLGFFWERFEMQDGVILKSYPSPLFRELLDAEMAFSKDGRTTKTPENQGNSVGILSNHLLPG